MMPLHSYTLNVGGRLVDLAVPKVMGIVNLTPDSFYAPSRMADDASALRRHVAQMVHQGASMIDVGACSTRPGSTSVDCADEMARLRAGLKIITEVKGDDTVLSVDTFRADVARMCVEEFGVGIVNDISGGTLDDAMFATVARLRVPYVITHMRGTPQTMMHQTDYADLMGDIVAWFSLRVGRLREMGVADIVIDPGFGFAKTTAQNLHLLAHLDELHEFDLPLLVGLSRKRVVCETLGVSADEALDGTTVLHTLALERGAHILRTHDVRPAAQAVALVHAFNANAS